MHNIQGGTGANKVAHFIREHGLTKPDCLALNDRNIHVLFFLSKRSFQREEVLTRGRLVSDEGF